MDKQTSVAPEAETLSASDVSITTLFPARSSNDDPAGMGAFVINSTSSPLLLSKVTVAVS